MIEEKSFAFALKIIELSKILQDKKEFVFANQILRSGTSIGANICETGAGQSKKDFIAKNGDFIQRSKRNQILVATFKRRKHTRNRLKRLS